MLSKWSQAWSVVDTNRLSPLLIAFHKFIFLSFFSSRPPVIAYIFSHKRLVVEGEEKRTCKQRKIKNGHKIWYSWSNTLFFLCLFNISLFPLSLFLLFQYFPLSLFLLFQYFPTFSFIYLFSFWPPFYLAK